MEQLELNFDLPSWRVSYREKDGTIGSYMVEADCYEDAVSAVMQAQPEAVLVVALLHGGKKETPSRA